MHQLLNITLFTHKRQRGPTNEIKSTEITLIVFYFVEKLHKNYIQSILLYIRDINFARNHMSDFSIATIKQK